MYKRQPLPSNNELSAEKAHCRCVTCDEGDIPCQCLSPKAFIVSVSTPKTPRVPLELIFRSRAPDTPVHGCSVACLPNPITVINHRIGTNNTVTINRLMYGEHFRTHALRFCTRMMVMCFYHPQMRLIMRSVASVCLFVLFVHQLSKALT